MNEVFRRTSEKKLFQWRAEREPNNRCDHWATTASRVSKAEISSSFVFSFCWIKSLSPYRNTYDIVPYITGKLKPINVTMPNHTFVTPHWSGTEREALWGRPLDGFKFCQYSFRALKKGITQKRFDITQYIVCGKGCIEHCNLTVLEPKAWCACAVRPPTCRASRFRRRRDRLVLPAVPRTVLWCGTARSRNSRRCSGCPCPTPPWRSGAYPSEYRYVAPSLKKIIHNYTSQFSRFLLV